MSRKKMNELAKQLRTMYLTESPVNFDDTNSIGYKYFLCFHNTHKIVAKTRNISDMIKKIEDVIENGATDGNFTFY